MCPCYRGPTKPTPPGAGLTICLQVREVKAKIAQEKGEYDAERMKVIYSGACLRDNNEAVRLELTGCRQDSSG